MGIHEFNNYFMKLDAKLDIGYEFTMLLIGTLKVIEHHPSKTLRQNFINVSISRIFHTGKLESLGYPLVPSLSNFIKFCQSYRL